MRAKNYDNQAASFKPLQPYEMLRVAIFDGMKPNYLEPERQRSTRLMKRYLDISNERIDHLFSLLEVSNPIEPQQQFLNDIIAQAAYDSGYWKRFDYNHLKSETEGLIIEHDGNLSGLARLVQETEPNKVIFVPAVGERTVDPEEEVDYLKHIPWRSKLVLNGGDVVKRFAQDRGFELPENYLKKGYMTQEVFSLLEQHGFYFIEALKTSIEVLKQPEYQNRIITALVIKRRDGTELRLHPHDFVEAAEFYTYCFLHNKEVIETLGDKLTEMGDKYHGANTFDVPKRTPVMTHDGLKSFDQVELHYFPNPLGDGPYPLDWMSTTVACSCDHALNMRNFEVRNSIMTRVVETMDTHADMVFLANMQAKGIGVEETVNNMSPIPTAEFSEYVDRTRYNIVQEFQVEENGRTRTKRTYVGEVGIEKLIHELAKFPEWTFERMFNPTQRVGRRLLRPMYV